MYIYLDQDNIDRLGKLDLKDPLYSATIQLFNDNDLTLVMSFTHIVESVKISTQTALSRKNFIDRIRNKKVIKQFIELIPGEIAEKFSGEKFSPFYNNFYEISPKTIPIVSDKFGYFEVIKDIKTSPRDHEKPNEEFRRIKEESLKFQKAKRFSRKEILNKYMNNTPTRNFLSSCIPKNLKNKEELIIEEVVNCKILLPTLETHLLIQTEMNLDPKRKLNNSDINDVFHLSGSLVYCDYVSADGYFSHIVSEAFKAKNEFKLGKCLTFGSVEELLNYLEQNLKGNKHVSPNP